MKNKHRILKFLLFLHFIYFPSLGAKLENFDRKDSSNNDYELLFYIASLIYLSVSWYSFCKEYSLENNPSIFYIFLLELISTEIFYFWTLLNLFYLVWFKDVKGFKEFFCDESLEKLSIRLSSLINIFYWLFCYKLSSSSPFSYISISFPKSSIFFLIFSY